MKPAILIDVDGVLNISVSHHVQYCKCHQGWIQRRVRPAGSGTSGFKLRMNPAVSRSLLQLSEEFNADLIWMTTWEDDANWEVGPWIGLPKMEVIPCPPRPYAWKGGGFGTWKARQAADWADKHERYFVWFDDEPDAASALSTMTKIPHLVITVDERTGLTDDYIEEARAWLRNHRNELGADAPG